MTNNPQSSGIMQPHIIGHGGPPSNPPPPMSMQFRSAMPPPLQPFVQVADQQFQSGGHANMGVPPNPLPIQYPSAVFPLAAQPPTQRSSHAGHAHPQGTPIPQPDVPPNISLMSATAQAQIHSSFMPGFGGPRISNISYSLSSSSSGQQQMNVVSAVQHSQMSQTDPPNYSAVGHHWFATGNQNIQSVLHAQQAEEQSAAGHPWFSTGTHNINPVTPLQQNVEQNGGAQQWFPNGNQPTQSGKHELSACVGKNISDAAQNPSLDWIEHTSRDGKKYYHNRRARVSSWEKPLELMTPTERADASTDWREYITSEGRRYYYNRITKKSKWAMPDEVKLAREQSNVTSSICMAMTLDVHSCVSTAVSVSGTETSTPDGNNLPISAPGTGPSLVSMTHTVNPVLAMASGSSSREEEVTNINPDVFEQLSPMDNGSSVSASDAPVLVTMSGAMNTPLGISNMSPEVDLPSSAKLFTGSVEEATRTEGSGEMSAALEEKKVDHGSSVYESKQEAKNAFKALMESANIGIDWNWDQAMRVIINDRRYGALRTLGEKKQAFKEYVGQKKKLEAEEKRVRLKKAREDFKKMLQESKDITSSTKWSKSISMFENDDRFQAVERAKDREELFEDHLEGLKIKERENALEEHKLHIAEYLEFLKSCDFIKASSQWRKVQHQLEADERCLRLEKIKRLEIFQEYVRDLELEEEEKRKLRIEEQRKAARKNRDDFRKLMEEHVANGILTANSHWRDYCQKVKDEPSYLAVSSNTSGSTAKDLFEDVLDDLDKQYMEDKEKIEQAVKNAKISVTTTWNFEDFKDALSEEIMLKAISDVNIKLVFEDLMEVTKEREEKEAKKRKRLADDVYEYLFKEVTSSSKWEDCKPLVEERFIGEESFFQEIFDQVILDLKEKTKDRKRKEEKAKKEKERKDKEKKEKERKHKDRGHERRKSKERRKLEETDSGGSNSESYSLEENKRSRDRRKKHQKRIMGSFDDNVDDDEKDHSRSHRYSTDCKRSKQMEKQMWIGNADFESQSKRHKRSHWDGSRKTTDGDECKDEDSGEDGEVQ